MFDFAVKYDPAKDSKEDITRRILYSLIIKRLMAKKPVVMFIGGDSGEGKSETVLKLQELLCEIQGLDLGEILHDVNVYMPTEYAKKLDQILFWKDKKYSDPRRPLFKKINFLAVHEARTLVRAMNWRTFINQAVGDVNAMSRSIKRMCFMIVSQFVRDISRDVRYTINYYCKIARPYGRPAKMYWRVLWKDDRDLESPKLRTRGLNGYLVYPNGRYRIFRPKYFEIQRPRAQYVKMFEEAEFKAKGSIIRRKMEELIREMEIETSVSSAKIDTMVDWYTKDMTNIHLLGKRNKNGWKVKKDVREMHGLTKTELAEFEHKLNEKLKNIGILDKPDQGDMEVLNEIEEAPMGT